MTEPDVRRAAELEVGLAKAGKDAAEFERDVMAGVAANNAAARGIAVADANDARIDADKSAAAVQDMAGQRDAVVRVALNEAAHREAAEAEAVDSRIVANHNAGAAQEMATERNLLRGDLAAERRASSGNAFGFYLMTALVVGSLLVGGIYYYFHRQDAANASQPGTTVSVNGIAPGSDSSKNQATVKTLKR